MFWPIKHMQMHRAVRKACSVQLVCNEATSRLPRKHRFCCHGDFLAVVQSCLGGALSTARCLISLHVGLPGLYFISYLCPVTTHPRRRSSLRCFAAALLLVSTYPKAEPTERERLICVFVFRRIGALLCFPSAVSAGLRAPWVIW